jgi:hypothetical protein
MSKDICILDINEASAGFINMRVVFWFTVSTDYPTSSATSAYPNINSDPATQGILGQIQSGAIVEEVYSFMFPSNWVSTQWAAIAALLIAYLNARKSFKAGTLVACPERGTKFGILHDASSGWSA